MILSLLDGQEFRQYGNVIVTLISAGLPGLILTPLISGKQR
ncbi:hypothetical protein PZB74_15300 [Porifericola rhodea]|nr:hypothetical protein [Porifericola rhodea]WKN30330.1 hypothetical protein PZB74_15300 [Porifericola rhodea]